MITVIGNAEFNVDVEDQRNVVAVPQVSPNVVSIIEPPPNIISVTEVSPNAVIVTVPSLQARQTLRYGNGAPTNLDYGIVGDMYINVDTGNFYGPKTVSGWPSSSFFAAWINVAASNQRHIHTQGSPSSTWIITHAIGGRPSVTVVDSGATVVHGDVMYNSNTQVTVLFSAPFSGYAYLT